MGDISLEAREGERVESRLSLGSKLSLHEIHHIRYTHSHHRLLHRSSDQEILSSPRLEHLPLALLVPSCRAVQTCSIRPCLVALGTRLEQPQAPSQPSEKRANTSDVS